jgi:hypothetical protein
MKAPRRKALDARFREAAGRMGIENRTRMSFMVDLGVVAACVLVRLGGERVLLARTTERNEANSR